MEHGPKLLRSHLELKSASGSLIQTTSTVPLADSGDILGSCQAFTQIHIDDFCVMVEHKRDISAQERLLGTHFRITNFLFVNKTPRSKCLSNSREDRLSFQALLHHAQKSRLSRLPQQRRLTYKTPTELLGWQRTPPIEASSLAPIQHALLKVLRDGKFPDVEGTRSSSHDDDNGLEIKEIVREEEQAHSFMPLAIQTNNNINQERLLALNQTITGENSSLGGTGVNVFEDSKNFNETSLSYDRTLATGEPEKISGSSSSVNRNGTPGAPQDQASVTRSSETSQINTYLDSCLDPFCRLPLTTSAEEKALISYYVTTMPLLAWGVRPDGLSNPVREITGQWMQVSPLAAQWIIIAAETHIASRRSLPLPLSVIRRKAKAYKGLTDALNDPLMQYTDNTLLGVLTATLAEGRYSGPDVTRMHLKGINTLVQARGGMQALPHAPRSFVILNLPCDSGLCGPHDAEGLMDRLFGTLNSIQEYSQCLRSGMNWVQDESSGSLASHSVIAEDFLLTRRKVLSSELISPLIRPRVSYANFVDMRTHFALLYSLNLILWDFGSKLNLGTKFLCRLLEVVQGSSAFDDDGKPVLRTNALLWILSKVLTDIYTAINERIAMAKEAWLCSACIDGLKIFSVVDDARRLKLLRLLYEWLSDLSSVQGNTEGSVEQNELCEDDLSAIRKEVRGHAILGH